MRTGWTTLRNFLARIVASTEVEATHDPIAYHHPQRAGELPFSQTSSLRRLY